MKTGILIKCQRGHRRHNTGAGGCFHSRGLQRVLAYELVKPAKGSVWERTIYWSAPRTIDNKCSAVFQNEINGILSPDANGGFWRIFNILAAAVTVGSPGPMGGHFSLPNQQQAVNPG